MSALDRTLWILRSDADEYRLASFCDDAKGYKLAAIYATAILDILTNLVNWDNPSSSDAERIALDTIENLHRSTETP